LELGQSLGSYHSTPKIARNQNEPIFTMTMRESRATEFSHRREGKGRKAKREERVKEKERD